MVRIVHVGVVLVKNTINVLKLQGKIVPSHNLIKSEEDIKWIKKAAKINNAVLDLVGEKICAGMTTEDIDKLVYDYTTSHGGIPACLGYEGFPKSVCTSINNEICHGIPSEKVVLKDGEIGKEAVRPWGYIGDIGAAIQEHAHKNGYSVVVDFCGHGVGNAFHEDPYVHHVGIRNTGMVIAPGMVFTIEPMINQGTRDLYIDKDNGWTSYTKDGKLSAQWENTILVTEKGIEVLAW